MLAQAEAAPCDPGSTKGRLELLSCLHVDVRAKQSLADAGVGGIAAAPATRAHALDGRRAQTLEFRVPARFHSSDSFEDAVLQRKTPSVDPLRDSEDFAWSDRKTHQEERVVLRPRLEHGAEVGIVHREALTARARPPRERVV